MNRLSLAFLLIVIVVILAGWVVLNKKSDLPQYQTTQVERGTIVSTVSASGNVLTANLMRVAPGASGMVKKVYVQDGDTVRVGQKLAEITLDQAGRQKNATAWASYLSAKNSVDAANATLYTLQSQLFAANQKLMSDAVARNLASSDPTYIQQNADWLGAEAKYKNQLSVIQQAKAALTSSWLSYQSTSAIITAPLTGTISNFGLVEGMILGENEVAIIRDEANPVLTFDLSEIDVPRVKIGQKATISLDSLSEKTFTGSVVAINTVGSTTNNVTSYPVVIKLDTNSAEILPNMAAKANIIIETKTEVLRVPSTAVQSQNNASFVRILENGQERRVIVQLGLSSDTQTEIISGLEAGDEVITGTTATASVGQGATNSPFGAVGRSGGGFGGAVLRPGGMRSGGGDQH